MQLKRTIPFVKYRWVLIAASCAFIIASFAVITTRGFNYGIDFEGGARLVYQFKAPVSEGEVKSALKDIGLGDAEVVRYGAAEDHRMSVKVEKPEQHAQFGQMITAALAAKWGADAVTLQEEQTVGPRVGKELRKKAWLAVIFAVILMLIYIGYRFDFLFAPGAVVALVHDVIIVLGFFAFFNKEFNLTILAALLTIVGYSVNDTIVVFDRIRENRHAITSETLGDVVNLSLNQTLSRTLITVLTTLFVVVVIFLKGGGSLHDFAFALLVGMITGTYSSLFIATPCYIGMYRSWPRIRAALGMSRPHQ